MVSHNVNLLLLKETSCGVWWCSTKRLAAQYMVLNLLNQPDDNVLHESTTSLTASNNNASLCVHARSIDVSQTHLHDLDTLEIQCSAAEA